MSSAPSSFPTQSRPTPTYTTSLLSGAFAGFAVDVSLFPLDTLKTRAQSAQGFLKAGGFKGVYSGLSSVVAGSAPGAAIFFTAYESLKPVFSSPSSAMPMSPSASHMLAASLAETAACLVRVPTEVVKSRMQAGVLKGRIGEVVRTILQREGLAGLFKGYGTTVAREIPFTCIQFPLYERLKLLLLKRQSSSSALSTQPITLPTYQAALVGAFSGGLAAAVTTPLDVVKTRLMLAERVTLSPTVAPTPITGSAPASSSPLGINQRFWPTLLHVYRSEGIRALFSGIIPRTIWISLGGAVFLGSFELGVELLENTSA